MPGCKASFAVIYISINVKFQCALYPVCPVHLSGRV